MTQSKPSESDIDSGDIETMKDLTKVMRDFIGKEQTNMNIIKLGVLNILQLKQFFPADGELIVGNVLKELISSQQTLMKTQFEAESFDTDQLSSLIYVEIWDVHEAGCKTLSSVEGRQSTMGH